MEKQRWEESERRGQEVRRSEREKVRREKMQVHEKVGKSPFTAFFKWFGAPEGRKVTSLERRVRSQLARWNWDERWKIARRRGEKHICKQKAKNTSRPDHFWKLSCRKSARRCAAKHISKSECRKHTSFGPLLEVEMSKKCTPLWREAHFQVKMQKTYQPRTPFGSWDVEKVHAVVARSTFPSQKCQKPTVSDHSWKLSCRKSAHGCGAKHIFKSKWYKHYMLGPLFDVQMTKKRTLLWRKAHFQVKSVKKQGFAPFLTLRCRKSSRWLT